jgi:hypothetical protein
MIVRGVISYINGFVDPGSKSGSSVLVITDGNECIIAAAGKPSLAFDALRTEPMPAEAIIAECVVILGR